MVKYSDNILKGFATSSSVVISCIFDSFFNKTELNETFGRGSLVVIASSSVYILITCHRQKSIATAAAKLKSAQNIDVEGGLISTS